VLLRNPGNRGEIERSHQHRPRVFEPDQSRVREKGFPDIVRLEVEKQRVRDSKSLDLLRKLKSGSVSVVHEQDVIAGAQQSHDHRTDGSHARAESLACFTLLERSKFFLEDLDSRVLASRVQRVPVLPRAGFDQCLYRFEREKRRLYDRRRHWFDPRLSRWLIFEADADVIG
jgi:hypothetical protein